MTDSLTPSRMTEIADLREILRSLQIANETPNGPISDTIWMAEGPETVFDALYDVIERLAAGGEQVDAPANKSEDRKDLLAVARILTSQGDLSATEADRLAATLRRVAAAGERAPLQGAEAGRAVAQRMLANPGMRSILQNLKDGAAGERVGDDFSGCRPPMRHIAGVSEETLRRAAGERVDAKAHEWEDADDVTMARAEVLSLIGLLAELDRMEQENRDDSLGGYCGAQVADFKRRYREAIARNGGAPAGERGDAPAEPYRANLQSQGYSIEPSADAPQPAKAAPLCPDCGEDHGDKKGGGDAQG